MPSQPGDIVWCVLCVEDGDDGDTLHIFSSRQNADEFCKTDPRPHVLYDYALDCPERHEGAAN